MTAETCKHIGMLIGYLQSKCAIAKSADTTDDNGEAMVAVPLAWFEMVDRKCDEITRSLHC